MNIIQIADKNIPEKYKDCMRQTAALAATCGIAYELVEIPTQESQEATAALSEMKRLELAITGSHMLYIDGDIVPNPKLFSFINMVKPGTVCCDNLGEHPTGGLFYVNEQPNVFKDLLRVWKKYPRFGAIRRKCMWHMRHIVIPQECYTHHFFTRSKNNDGEAKQTSKA